MNKVMKYDLSKLRGRVIEKNGKQRTFSEAMNWSERTGSLKLSGKVFWKQDEITRACEILSIKDDEIQVYFFTHAVQSN